MLQGLVGRCQEDSGETTEPEVDPEPEPQTEVDPEPEEPEPAE